MLRRASALDAGASSCCRRAGSSDGIALITVAEVDANTLGSLRVAVRRASQVSLGTSLPLEDPAVFRAQVTAKEGVGPVPAAILCDSLRRNSMYGWSTQSVRWMRPL